MAGRLDTRLSRLEKGTPLRDPNDPWDFVRDLGWWWYVERQPYNQAPPLVMRDQVESRIRELEAKGSQLPKWEAKLLETFRQWLVDYPPEDFVKGRYIGPMLI